VRSAGSVTSFIVLRSKSSKSSKSSPLVFLGGIELNYFSVRRSRVTAVLQRLLRTHSLYCQYNLCTDSDRSIMAVSIARVRDRHSCPSSCPHPAGWLIHQLNNVTAPCFSHFMVMLTRTWDPRPRSRPRTWDIQVIGKKRKPWLIMITKFICTINACKHQ